jgi:hypothetical protein
MLAAVPPAAVPPPYTVPVIRPGHEGEVAKMFKLAPLPRGCTSDDISIARDRLVATLACDNDLHPVLELVAPEVALEAPKTKHYAVTFRGNAPDGLDREIAAALEPYDVVSIWSTPEPQTAPPIPRRTIAGIALFSVWPLIELVRGLRQRRRVTR